MRLIEYCLVYSNNPESINGLFYLENIKKFIKETLKIESTSNQKLALLTIIMCESKKLETFPDEMFARMFEGVHFRSFKPVMEVYFTLLLLFLSQFCHVHVSAAVILGIMG